MRLKGKRNRTGRGKLENTVVNAVSKSRSFAGVVPVVFKFAKSVLKKINGA